MSKEQMPTYPRLFEMGVMHPQQIARFSVNSVDYIDFLRVFYDRPTGSLLPVSRTYRFPRVQKKVSVQSDAAQDQVVMESSPTFREAIQELREIVEARTGRKDIAALMLDELHRLEEDFALHSASFKALIDEIKSA